MEGVKKLDKIILGFILMNLLFFRYIKVFYNEWYSLDAVLIAYSLSGLLKGRISPKILMYFSALAVSISVLLNVWKFGASENVVDNLMMFISPASITLYFLYLNKKYNFTQKNRILKVISHILNAYFVINTLIIIVQIKTATFMMEKFIKFNPYVPDHMAGFIGANGVSVLNYLWITTLVLNIYFYFRNKSLKGILNISFQIVLMFVLSEFIDNKMFLVTTAAHLISFLLLYLFTKGINARNAHVWIVAALVILFAIPTVFNNENFVSQFEKTNELAKDFMSGESGTPNKNNERAYLNYLAFNVYGASDLGIGMKNVDLLHQNIHKHLGINSASLVLIQGGIVLMMSLVFFYSALIFCFFRVSTGISRLIIFSLVSFNTMLCAYATQPFRDHYIIICFSLIFLTYEMYIESSQPINNEIYQKDRGSVSSEASALRYT